ncbi:PDZ domain-containing protein [Metabacillus herbersteinensis]|uniref:PDZ domain-containing protein n=1 Tax=Metabacillus herbersteinensis TaxID=283816 RepID=A0ABV6GJS2_9BACI
MLENWMLELLGAIGRFFIHPLLFFFILVSLAFGYFRLKRERKSFHTRVQDIFEELRFTYTKGILAGLAISLVTVVLGLSVPFGVLVILAIVTALLSLTFQLRWLSAAFTLGVTLFASVILSKLGNESVANFFIDIEKVNFAGIAILLGLLVIAEGILTFKSAHIRTSPFLIKSTRGLPIGTHLANRTWMLPLFLFVPGGSLVSDWTWWPVLTVNDQSFMLICVPFFLGFHQRVQGSLPLESIKVTATRVIWLGVVTTIVAVASIWFTPLVFVAVLSAMLGREFLTIKQRMNDDSAAFYFSKRDKGLMVLGILPNSPAEKLNLQVGEMIMKVNGFTVKTVSEFYQGLQKNRAFCKLEVIDLNGEIRFEQRALYEGEHHELGILFVQDEKKWETEAV